MLSRNLRLSSCMKLAPRPRVARTRLATRSAKRSPPPWLRRSPNLSISYKIRNRFSLLLSWVTLFYRIDMPAGVPGLGVWGRLRPKTVTPLGRPLGACRALGWVTDGSRRSTKYHRRMKTIFTKPVTDILDAEEKHHYSDALVPF